MMKPIRIAMHRRLNRRTFLRGAGVALALPMLDAMTPALLRRASATSTTTRAGWMPRRRRFSSFSERSPQVASHSSSPRRLTGEWIGEPPRLRTEWTP